jgi:L-2-hydroxyglutarate oxidase
VGFMQAAEIVGSCMRGFYYTKDSLKAKLTVDGNRLMKEFCHNQKLHVHETKKVVVAQNKGEIQAIHELHHRAQINGARTEIIRASALKEIDPNVKTTDIALYSPDTASVSPKEICFKLKEALTQKNVDFYFNQRFETHNISYNHLINCAGLYADKIAHQFGIARNYTLLPFKGVYLKYYGDDKPLSINVYPVPNLNNPFLGVHYTITAANEIKIGPTAIPALWRENYKGFDRFKMNELSEILLLETKLFVKNAFGFRKLAIEEIKNYNRSVMIKKARAMLHTIGHDFRPIQAGIRAQLLNKETNELVTDFVIEHKENTTHILNAVSPAFTCSFAFAKMIIDQIKERT